jgi:hypothetical protein
MKKTQSSNTPPLHHSSFPITIVSGGQTGADRAALDWALKHNLPCGGWCPKGRKAEDGPIDSKYPLKETPSSSYLQRTEWNVRDSDATVLFSIQPTLSGGSKRTMEFARKQEKPCLHLCAADSAPADRLKAFTEEHRVTILNVAGPRASNEPGVGEFVMRILDKAFGETDEGVRR